VNRALSFVVDLLQQIMNQSSPKRKKEAPARKKKSTDGE
jgi:hypothetical protein